MPGEIDSYTVTVNGQRLILCRSDQNVLMAMERSGGTAIPVGCRRGGCGACRVRVLSGKYFVGKMSARYVTKGEIAEGLALACCLRPLSDLALDLAPSSKCAFQPRSM